MTDKYLKEPLVLKPKFKMEPKGINQKRKDGVIKVLSNITASHKMQFWHDLPVCKNLCDENINKVSTSPGRYMLSDSKLDNDATTALILSQYPWGKQIAETISVQPSTYTSEKHTHIWTVKSTTSLEWALLNLLCDSAVDSILERNVLRLHRKMAPYKCALAVDFTDESNYDQLSQLAFYLSLKLRQSGICTFLPSDLKVQLGTQLSLNDECGTPYTIIVNNDTLKTGVTEFYNRDTTWREKIHVSDITSYTQKLFSNF